MTIVPTITVDYVSADNPIPTTGMVSGDYCLDKSNNDWYLYSGSVWNLKYVNVMQHGSAATIDVRYETSDNIVFKKVSAAVVDMRYAMSDNIVLKHASAAVDRDISEVIKKIPRLLNED